MKIETINFKDVRGKELLYLKLTNRKQEEYLINVGIKTYAEVTRMINEDNKSSDQIKLELGIPSKLEIDAKK